MWGYTRRERLVIVRDSALLTRAKGGMRCKDYIPRFRGAGPV